MSTYYSDASRRHAEQTGRRAVLERIEKEEARLRALGCDEAWIKRVLTASDRREGSNRA
jgi:hypothetical protein